MEGSKFLCVANKSSRNLLLKSHNSTNKKNCTNVVIMQNYIIIINRRTYARFTQN